MNNCNYSPEWHPFKDIHTSNIEFQKNPCFMTSHDGKCVIFCKFLPQYVHEFANFWFQPAVYL